MGIPEPRSSTAPEGESGFGLAHSVLVRLACFAVDSFFHDIKIVGAENIDYEAGIILASSHANMALDPACLSYGVIKAGKGNSKPYIHYWAKNTIFKNPLFGKILINAGNIPVDRKTKNNQILFKGTFDSLHRNEIVGVFPEGTSHHNSRMIPLKDGVAWTALEYLTYLEDEKGGAAVKGSKKAGSRVPAKVVPVGITYSDKTKYRSRVVVEFGKPISMDEYAEEFLSGEEGAAKAAVKRLTTKIGDEIFKLTVNAEDWDTLNAAQMARELLWEEEQDLRMEDFVEVSQTLADLLADPQPSPALAALKTTLITYHSYLTEARLTNSSLTHIPLPSNLDPTLPIPLPTRFSTLWVLIRDILSSLVRLPFFALPFLVNIPIYLIGKFGVQLALDEVETQAQMKLALGVISSLLVYPAVAFGLFLGVFRTGGVMGTIVGLCTAGLCVWGLVMYHLSLIDDNYRQLRKLIAALRILIGIWSPRAWDIVLRPSSFAKDDPNAPPPPPRPVTPASLVPGVHESSFPPPYEPNKPKIPSRRLIRQVLKTRLLSSKALEAYLISLESDPEQRVPSSAWLASGERDVRLEKIIKTEGVGEEKRVEHVSQTVRTGKEVVEFLRHRGARIVAGRHAGEEAMHWLNMLEEEGEQGAGETKKKR